MVNEKSSVLIVELFKACEKYTDNVALMDGFSSFTYRDLKFSINEVGRMYSELPMNRCLIMPGSTVDSLISFYALIQANKIPFLGDPSWQVDDIIVVMQAYGISDAFFDAKWFDDPSRDLNISYRENLCALGEFRTLPGEMEWFHLANHSSLAEVNIDSKTEFVRFSSGSTGHPRALQFSGSAAVAAAQGWSASACYTESEIVFCLATLNNGLAFNTSILPVFLSGGATRLYRAPLLPSAILTEVKRCGATVFVGFPFIFKLLLSKKAILKEVFQSVRLVVSSAAPLEEKINEDWREASGKYIGHYYGIAEAGPVTFNDGSSRGSGFAIKGNFIKITRDYTQDPPVDRISVKTPSMAIEYISDGGKTISSSMDDKGYYQTQDLGRVERDGSVVITGRNDKVINIAGVKIDPNDIERVINRNPLVKDSVVESRKGNNCELIVAFIESDYELENDLRDYCIDNLPRIKIPHRFVFVKKFPKSSTGKVRLANLRKLYKQNVNDESGVTI